MKIKAYHIDTIKVDTPQHIALRFFQKIAFDSFPTIIGFQVDDKSDFVKVLGLENLCQLHPSFLDTQNKRIATVFDIFKSIWLLHQKQYFLGQISLEKILFFDDETKQLKIKPYLTVHKNNLKTGTKKQQQKHENIENPKPEQKKQNVISKKNTLKIQQKKQQIVKLTTKILNPQVQIQNIINQSISQDPQRTDMMKWALFTAQQLYILQKSKYLERLKANKNQQFKIEIKKKSNFANSDQLMKVIIQCLNPNLKKPKIQQIFLIFRQILDYVSVPVNSQSFQTCRVQYQKIQSQIMPQFSMQISQDILLNQQLKKKLSQHFLKNNHKSGPKSFKALYRASRFKFSTKIFYIHCSNQSKLLFVMDTEEAGIICFYLQPKLTIDQNEGLTGNYIADPQQKSFIFSVKNQQSYKLGIKEKAFRMVPGKGPVIGDGDIIIGNQPNRNWCYFPKSYQTGKAKQLLNKNQFTMKNYDVYTLTF